MHLVHLLALRSGKKLLHLLVELIKPRQPQAGSATTPWSGSMTFTMVCTSEGGVKNSPLSCAPWMANFMRKYS
jgi:hypothetical protein